MKKLIVIPTYNEKENITELIKVIFLVAPDSHILVVDDGSPDGTGKAVEDFSQKDQRVHLLKRTEKKGLGRAYIAGFKWALDRGYDFISEMDADWSHPPRFLVSMYAAAQKNDFVVGSRYIKGGGSVNWSFSRKLISRCGSFYSRLILGVPINDFTGGFNGWHARVLKAIDLEGITTEGYSFQIELKYRAARGGFKFAEFPLIFEERREGQSKMSTAIVKEAIWKVWTMRFNDKSKRVSKVRTKNLPSDVTQK